MNKTISLNILKVEKKAITDFLYRENNILTQKKSENIWRILSKGLDFSSEFFKEKKNYLIFNSENFQNLHYTLS